MGSETMISTCSGSETSSTFPGMTTMRSVRLLLFTKTCGWVGQRGHRGPCTHSSTTNPQGREGFCPHGHPIPSASFIGTLTRAMISHSLSPTSGPYRIPHVTINPERALLMGVKMGTIGFAIATKAKLGYTLHPSTSSARNVSYEHNCTQKSETCMRRHSV